MSDQYIQYTTVSWAGRELLKKHKLTDEGIWHIFGEDPNADLHGAHHQPDLGIVTGKLEDIIRYAISLPKFWQWGAGGDIKFIGKTLPKIDANSAIRREELNAEVKRLEERLKQAKKELGDL